MEDGICFIDKEGKRFSCDTIASHIGLAKLIIEQDSKLGEEYKASNKIDPVDFLISNKGYMRVTNQGCYRVLVFDSTTISNMQRGVIRHYNELGFRLEDMEVIKQRMQKNNELR